jgi:hypothetical protein
MMLGAVKGRVEEFQKTRSAPDGFVAILDEGNLGVPAVKTILEPNLEVDGPITQGTATPGEIGNDSDLPDPVCGADDGKDPARQNALVGPGVEEAPKFDVPD